MENVPLQPKKKRQKGLCISLYANVPSKEKRTVNKICTVVYDMHVVVFREKYTNGCN